MDDTRTGVDRKDRYLKDKLMSQFVNHDSHSRPCTPEYAENWDRIFGKKQERSDSENVVTVRLNHVDGRIEHVEVTVDGDAG